MQSITLTGTSYSPTNNFTSSAIRGGAWYPGSARIRGFGEPVQSVGGNYSLSGYFDTLAGNLAAGKWAPLLDSLDGAERARAIELSARLAELNSQLLQDGKWTPAEYQRAMANLENDNPDGYFADVTSAAVDGANQGMNELTLAAVDSTANLAGAATKATIAIAAKISDEVVKAVASTTPWWVWVGLIAAGAWYVGLASRARNAFAR